MIFARFYSDADNGAGDQLCKISTKLPKIQ